VVLRRRHVVEMLLSTGTSRPDILVRMADLARRGELPRRYPVRTIDRDIATIRQRWTELGQETAASVRDREVARLTRIAGRLEAEGKWVPCIQALRLKYDLQGLAAPRRVDVGGTVAVQAEHAVAQASEEQARELLARIEARVRRRIAVLEEPGAEVETTPPPAAER
jgi:hypothetical protein